MILLIKKNILQKKSFKDFYGFKKKVLYFEFEIFNKYFNTIETKIKEDSFAPIVLENF